MAIVCGALLNDLYANIPAITTNTIPAAIRNGCQSIVFVFTSFLWTFLHAWSASKSIFTWLLAALEKINSISEKYFRFSSEARRHVSTSRISSAVASLERTLPIRSSISYFSLFTFHFSLFCSLYHQKDQKQWQIIFELLPHDLQCFPYLIFNSLYRYA